MSNLILLAICYGIGVALRHSARMPQNAASALNTFIIYVSLPAVTLYYVHAIDPHPSLLVPAIMPWLFFACGLAFFWLAGRMMRLSRASTGGLMLIGSLGNTSFVGLPMIETFYGTRGLATGIVVDQLGSYLVLSTLGVVIAGIYSRGDAAIDIRAIAWKVAKFPPFIAVIVALALLAFTYPAWLDDILLKLGATLAPLALTSVGLQLKLGDLRGRIGALSVGLAFKLLLGPALMLMLLAAAFGTDGEHFEITIFEAAMAPMIGATIVAMEHDLDPPLATMMVGIGIPLSFFTLPVWFYALQSL